MPRSSSLISLVLLSLAFDTAYANPLRTGDSPSPPSLTTISLTRRSFPTDFRSILEADQARAMQMRQRGGKITGLVHDTDPNGHNMNARRASSFPASNSLVTYTTEVGVGYPATNYTLLIDTGSSNTWVGAGKPYNNMTSTSKLTGAVAVTYGSGSFAGLEYRDRVTLSPSLVIKQQSIGAAITSTGFNGVDGILGVGPTDLTQGTTAQLDGTPQPDATVPTVSDNLLAQGTIKEEVLGIFFSPTFTGSNTDTGELTFGATDHSKYTGNIIYTPLTTRSPSSAYWGIDEKINYGGTTILNSTAGIVDTGTTLILIATDAFGKYQNMTGAVQDQATGLLSITPAQYKNLKNLQFIINGHTFSLTPNAQIFPRAYNRALGGMADKIYLMVNDIGQKSGSGLDFINGYAFLQRYYSVFDTTNSRVGFAPTKFTDATSN